MKKYRVVHDYGAYEGMKFYDEDGYNTVAEAVKAAVDANYSTKWIIVQLIDWEATQKCPYPDCPKVKYYGCPVHGQKNMTSPSTANEKVLQEFDRLFTYSHPGDSGPGGNDPQDATYDWMEEPGEVKAFLLKALSDRAEEIAVEIEKYVVVANGEKEVGLKVSAEIARSFTH